MSHGSIQYFNISIFQCFNISIFQFFNLIIFMLFVNISSDYVHLFDGLDEDFLPRNGIENILGTTLLQYTQRHPVETLFLLNGPGGFTNLRVGTLAINTLNTLLQHDTGTFIPIASITKIDLYTYAYKQ